MLCVFAFSPGDSKMKMNTSNYRKDYFTEHDCTCPVIETVAVVVEGTAMSVKTGFV